MDPRAVGRETVTPGAGSWWLGKSRDDLAREASARAAANSNTRIGRSITPRHLD